MAIGSKSPNEPNFNLLEKPSISRPPLSRACSAAPYKFEVLDEEEDEPEVVWNRAEENGPGISPTPKYPGNDGDGEGTNKGDHGHHKDGQAVCPLNAAENGAEVHEVAT